MKALQLNDKKLHCLALFNKPLFKTLQNTNKVLTFQEQRAISSFLAVDLKHSHLLENH